MKPPATKNATLDALSAEVLPCRRGQRKVTQPPMRQG